MSKWKIKYICIEEKELNKVNERREIALKNWDKQYALFMENGSNLDSIKGAMSSLNAIDKSYIEKRKALVLRNEYHGKN